MPELKTLHRWFLAMFMAAPYVETPFLRHVVGFSSQRRGGELHGLERDHNPVQTGYAKPLGALYAGFCKAPLA